MLSQPRQQVGSLCEVKPTGQWRVDGGHEVGIEHVNVEMDPETRTDACDPLERFPGDARDSGTFGSGIWYIQHSERRKRRVAILRLSVITAADVHDMLTTDQRIIPGQMRQGQIGSPDGQGQVHAAGRVRCRFGERREVGVCVDVDQANRS